MPTPLEIAYKCAPVMCHKIDKDNPRGDFLTRIDFAKKGDLSSLADNWDAVNERIKSRGRRTAVEKEQPPRFKHALEAYVYYSVVETHTHYLILYAIYHPQDWEVGETGRKLVGPFLNLLKLEHEHDMEGALVIAGKRRPLAELRADAMITISHHWFYSYANWRFLTKRNKAIDVFSDPRENRYKGSRVNKETLDGNLWAIWHRDGGERNDTMRPTLYIQARGHGIRGDEKKWGGGDRVIHYCPSLSGADEPSFETNNRENPNAKLRRKNSLKAGDVRPVTDVCRYKLIDIFEPNTGSSKLKGLWASRNEDSVFRVNDSGQDCFVKRGRGKLLEPGDAKPPWSWDDSDDAHGPGELALQPARIVYDYLGGLREFSLEYVRNPYLEIR